ncbi:MAG: glycosyltransferase family 1 protein [Gemmatimonadota bacterium]|nr:glycosyltransferase family 1 protein [Gemmatimonadota bacterium]
MVTIGIDASRANAPRRTGAEWYAYHLIQALKRLEIPGVAWVLYSRAPLRDGLERMPAHWCGRIVPWKHLPLWTLCGLSWELRRRPVDLLFAPTHILPLFPPRRVVTTLHDIGFVRLPNLYAVSNRLAHRLAARRAVRIADRILTVSEFSRQEIITAYRVAPGRVSVTANAVDPAVYSSSITAERRMDVLARYRLTQPFFLYLGRLEAKKNVTNILRAFAQVRQRRGGDDTVALVLAGTPGFGFDRIAAAIGDAGPDSHLQLPGYVPEEDVPALIAGARALVFPGCYEGFGIPILQAQAVGTPVITANHSAMPEVAGAGALFVNAQDPAAIAQAMERLLDDAAMHASLRSAGFLNVRRFSWEHTARRTMDILLEVLDVG